MKSTFYSIVETDNSVHLPESGYWRERLKCKGCNLPLTPPVFYCYNTTQVHALCRNCNHCNVPNCLSKVSPNRSVILEKLLGLACFSCEFDCKKSLLEASEYKLHVKGCHFRPLKCSLCSNPIEFRGYFQHLRRGHDMKRVLLDRETLIIDFAKGQPKLRYVRFNRQIFIIRYENLKLWVELLSLEREMSEELYKIRVSGVKYKIELTLEVLNVRSGQQTVMKQLEDEDSNNNIYGLKKFVMPPLDEELFLLFIFDYDDTPDKSDLSSSTNSFKEFRSRNSDSIFV
ncbi:unnamed protein product [Allacma fusca]|uniref:C2H2-type domain-containing protein n=1 Tax=Allacma fusca TaxID=39272 RepID=A0A8J2JZF3_9HEXA|nr:unnamed protein product [Allacma fusca]